MISKLAKGKVLGFIPTPYFIALLLVGGYVFVPAFNSAVNDLWNSLQLSSVPGLTGGGYQGNVQFIFTIQDAITGATVNPTNDVYYYFADMPSKLAGGTGLTTTGHTLAADPDGECWIAIGDANDNFFCPDLFESINSAFILPGGFWADLADDNKPDYVAHINTANVGVTGQAQTPALNLVAPWLNEDATLTLSSPADADNTGASATTVAITWTITGCTADDGFYIARIYFTDNNTIASGICHPDELTISNGLSGGGRATWDGPIKEVEGSTPYYYYLDGLPDYKEFQNGERYWYETGESATIYITANFDVDLVAGSLVTIYVDQVDGEGTVTTDSDSVNINITS